MRMSRIKPDSEDMWHHCYNRAVGTEQDRPLGPVEKEMFVRILLRLSRFFCVQPVAFQIMSTHYHLLLRTPELMPSEDETCRRYAEYYGGKRRIEPGTEACRIWQARLRDVSWFQRLLQQRFTVWYNRTRPVRRRGPLWADRFKNTLIESGEALWRCWAYVENNAVRAGLVADAADYRFGSLGRWAQRGRHPLEANALSALLPALGPLLGAETIEDLCRKLRRELAVENRDDAAPAGAEAGFVLTARRRVRFWRDGVVIGSELFVRGIMSRVRSREEARRHRLARSRPELSGDPLHAWRRLRVDLN